MTTLGEIFMIGYDCLVDHSACRPQPEDMIYCGQICDYHEAGIGLSIAVYILIDFTQNNHLL